MICVDSICKRKYGLNDLFVMGLCPKSRFIFFERPKKQNQAKADQFNKYIPIFQKLCFLNTPQYRVLNGLERRLIYVGVTRAMNKLFITYTDRRMKYGKEKPSVPSRFLDEIPENVIKKLDRFVKSDPEKDKAYVKRLYDELMAKLDD